MPLIYITGISGSGKSAVLQELKHRGHKAFGVDEDRIAKFYNNETGEPFLENTTPEDRTPEWRSKHTWKAKREVVEELAKANGDRPVFLCGVTANDADELWDLFDHVFALTLDEATLRHRIQTRTANDFGKNEHEFQTLLEWQRTAAEDYKKLGATLVDATQPLREVVDDIELRVTLKKE